MQFFFVVIILRDSILDDAIWDEYFTSVLCVLILLII